MWRCVCEGPTSELRVWCSSASLPVPPIPTPTGLHALAPPPPPHSDINLVARQALAMDRSQLIAVRAMMGAYWCVGSVRVPSFLLLAS